jgi:hypothetical protein
MSPILSNGMTPSHARNGWRTRLGEGVMVESDGQGLAEELEGDDGGE